MEQALLSLNQRAGFSLPFSKSQTPTRIKTKPRILCSNPAIAPFGFGVHRNPRLYPLGSVFASTLGDRNGFPSSRGGAHTSVRVCVCVCSHSRALPRAIHVGADPTFAARRSRRCVRAPTRARATSNKRPRAPAEASLAPLTSPSPPAPSVNDLPSALHRHKGSLRAESSSVGMEVFKECLRVPQPEQT